MNTVPSLILCVVQEVNAVRNGTLPLTDASDMALEQLARKPEYMAKVNRELFRRRRTGE